MASSSYRQLVNVRRSNPWYGRSLQTLAGDWVLRAGWFHWIEHRG